MTQPLEGELAPRATQYINMYPNGALGIPWESRDQAILACRDTTHNPIAVVRICVTPKPGYCWDEDTGMSIVRA